MRDCPSCIQRRGQWFAQLLTSVALALLFSGAAQAQRLPQNVAPVNYKLSLDPSIQGRKFSGEETISLQVAQATSEIVLNSLGLEISLAEVTAGTRTQAARVSYDPGSEMVRLALAHDVPAGRAELRLKFSGKLTDGLRGLYLSRTRRRAYAVTQFEGTYARMMFPSFDEPAFKATFDLTVIADKSDTAISNGRIIADVPVPGSRRHKLTFSTSPRMSTYLLALAVGDWQCLGRTVSGVPVRVCAVPEKKEQARFALEVATHALEFYDQWYGIKYPFGKLDMLAIPDYEWGGMENTASIFYRDTALLLNEATTSVFNRRAHATVIAHEIAHQWFGDLVTAAWWDDIWLNEGFATWMERKPIAAWHPEWRLEEDAAARAQEIIGLDSLAAARAIHGNPSTPGEIKEMFDGITYQKGGAVLRMLESYVGPETFRKGVNLYLQTHANGNATAEDFWKALAQVSGKPIDQIMPTFVMQPGVPVVSVSGSCHTDNLSLDMKQQRFYLSAADANGDHEQLWQIPICVKADRDLGSSCFVADKKTQEIALNACPDWFFANRDAKGYYRVEYDPRNLAAMAGAAERGLTSSERIAFVEDAWAMTRSGKYSVSTFLSLVKALREEPERQVLDLVAGHLQYIDASLVAGEREEDYRQFIRAQFAPLAQQTGWATQLGDSDERKALRASLLKALGEAGDSGAMAAARAMVQQYLKDPTSVDGTVAASAFAVAAENGDAALYDQFSAALPGTKSAEEYEHYFLALAQFPQPALIQRTLELITQGKVRQQDYPRLFSTLLANPAARDLTWNYLKAHWSDLAEKVITFGGRGAVSELGNFCSAAERDDVKQFFTGHRAPGAERALQQSLERMNSCIEFQQMQQKNMQQWLTEKAP